MRNAGQIIGRVLHCEQGVNSIEFALLIGLIALVLVGAFGSMGESLNSLYLSVNSDLLDAQR